MTIGCVILFDPSCNRLTGTTGDRAVGARERRSVLWAFDLAVVDLVDAVDVTVA